MLIIKSFLRFFVLFVIYPKPGLAYLSRIIGHCYGFKYYAERDLAAAINFKKSGKLSNINIGHATNFKTIGLEFLSFKLFEVIINEGEELTAEHFFFNRSIKDIHYLLNLSKPFLRLDESSIIFDSACGTGRHLYYVTDTYRSRGIGIDIYEPTIAVANKANIGKSIRFHCGSSLDLNYINERLPLYIDLIVINSWLGYVKDEKYFSEFVSKIIKISGYIMIISAAIDDIHSIFQEAKFIVEKKIKNTQYVLL